MAYTHLFDIEYYCSNDVAYSRTVVLKYGIDLECPQSIVIAYSNSNGVAHSRTIVFTYDIYLEYSRLIVFGHSCSNDLAYSYTIDLAHSRFIVLDIHVQIV